MPAAVTPLLLYSCAHLNTDLNPIVSNALQLLYIMTIGNAESKNDYSGELQECYDELLYCKSTSGSESKLVYITSMCEAADYAKSDMVDASQVWGYLEAGLYDECCKAGGVRVT